MVWTSVRNENELVETRGVNIFMLLRVEGRWTISLIRDTSLPESAIVGNRRLETPSGIVNFRAVLEDCAFCELAR